MIDPRLLLIAFIVLGASFVAGTLSIGFGLLSINDTLRERPVVAPYDKVSMIEFSDCVAGTCRVVCGCDLSSPTETTDVPQSP